MKPLKKDIYQEMKYGKRELTIISIVVMILSIAMLAGGIVSIVFGAINPNGAWQIIWRVLLGVVLVILGGIFFGIGLTMFAVTRSMINTDEGNVADGNRAKGTLNVRKCDKCGQKLNDDAKFCSKCGKSVESKKCTNCGKEMNGDSQFCEYCGKSEAK